MTQTNPVVADAFSKFDEAPTTPTDSLSVKNEDTPTPQEAEDKSPYQDEANYSNPSKKEEKPEAKKEEPVPQTEETLPFHNHPRWQQVIKDRHEARREARREREENLTLKHENELLKASKEMPNDEDLENMTYEERKEAIREAVRKEEEMKLKHKAEMDKVVEQEIDDQLQTLKDLGHKFDEEELLDIASDYTQGDIDKAFELYQKLHKNDGIEVKQKVTHQREAAKKSDTPGRKANAPIPKYTKGMGNAGLRNLLLSK